MGLLKRNWRVLSLEALSDLMKCCELYIFDNIIGFLTYFTRDELVWPFDKYHLNHSCMHSTVHSSHSKCKKEIAPSWKSPNMKLNDWQFEKANDRFLDLTHCYTAYKRLLVCASLDDLHYFNIWVTASIFRIRKIFQNEKWIDGLCHELQKATSLLVNVAKLLKSRITFDWVW